VDEKRVKANLYFDKDVRQMLRESAFLSTKSMSDIVNILLRKSLKEYLEELKKE
jgi:hypothetical protein